VPCVKAYIILRGPDSEGCRRPEEHYRPRREPAERIARMSKTIPTCGQAITTQTRSMIKQPFPHPQPFSLTA